MTSVRERLNEILRCASNDAPFPSPPPSLATAILSAAALDLRISFLIVAHRPLESEDLGAILPADSAANAAERLASLMAPVGPAPAPIRSRLLSAIVRLGEGRNAAFSRLAALCGVIILTDSKLRTAALGTTLARAMAFRATLKSSRA